MRESATLPGPGWIGEFKDGEWHFEPPTTGRELAASPGAGPLSAGVADFEIFGVELGEALAGLLVAGIADLVIGLVTGFLPGVGGIPSNVMRGIILFVAAAIIQMPAVKGPLGATAANAASLLLAADAITAVFDLRGLVGGFFAGALGSGGGGGRSAMASLAGASVQASPAAGRMSQAQNADVARVAGIGV